MNEAVSPQDHLQQLKALMEEGIPFNVFLGLECEHLEVGSVTLRMPFRDELVGDPFRPALHGGTLSALADTAGGAAVFSAIAAGARASTIDLRIDYLRPGRLEDVWAEAEVMRLGNRVGVTRIVLWQKPGPDEAEGRSVIAEATGVYSVRVPETP